MTASFQIVLKAKVSRDRAGSACSRLSAEHFTEAVRADRAGLQIAVYDVGDAAVRRALAGLEATLTVADGKVVFER